MRVALFILLVFGSIESYRIELYNTADVAVYVQKMRNNVISNVTLPPSNNGNPTSWNMTGLGANAFVVFVVDNLVSQIQPSQTDPNVIDVFVRYLYDTSNTTLNQKVYIPGKNPPGEYTFMCNDLYAPAECVLRMGNFFLGPNNFLNISLRYDANLQPLKIYYSKPTGINIKLFNNASSAVKVLRNRNGALTSVILPARTGTPTYWTTTQIFPNERISFIMDNLSAYVIPSTTPPALEFGVGYHTAAGITNTTIGMTFGSAGYYEQLLECNLGPTRFPQACLRMGDYNFSNALPSKKLTLRFPYDEYEIKYSDPKPPLN